MKKRMMLTLAAMVMLGMGAAPAVAESGCCGDTATHVTTGYNPGTVYTYPTARSTVTGYSYGESTVGGWAPSPGPHPGMGYKFGRGVVNVLTFWTEIPRNVALEWQRTDPASGFFLGVGKGFGYGYARLMAGFYDMISFPFPVPMGFAPVMQPEFSAENPYRVVATREFVEPLRVMPSHYDIGPYRDGAYRDYGPYRDGAYRDGAYRDYGPYRDVEVYGTVRPARQWP